MADPSPSPEISKRFPQLRLLALIFAGLILVLVGWYFLVLRQDYAILYHDLRSSDAAAVVAELEKEGVTYRLRNGGSDILVPSSQTDAVRLHLASSETPLNGLDGFELFNESDMGLTDFAQKIRYQRALQGELTRTITRMDGVIEARVHISMPERTLFRGERRNAEAAVTLTTRSSADETPALVEGVQRLVAASVPDLSVADVVVLNSHGEVISPRVEVVDPGVGPAFPRHSDPDSAIVDYVMALMRQALPGRRFEVSIELTPAALAGQVDDGIPPREPTRLVKVTTETALTVREMERVGELLRRADVLEGLSGAALSFHVAPPTLAASDSAISTSEHAAKTRNAAALSEWPVVLFVIFALILAGCAFGFFWLRSRPRLSFEEHMRIAEQLRQGMQQQEQGGANA